MKAVAEFVDGTFNGKKNVYLIITILVTMVAGWYNLKGTVELVALNQAVLGCEVSEVRNFLQTQTPFGNQCYKLVTDEVQRKARGLP